MLPFRAISAVLGDAQNRLFALTVLLFLRLPAACDSPLAELRWVQQLLEKGDLPGAREKLIQTLKRYPNEHTLHNFLGVVEAQQGNYPAAESSFLKAIALAPGAAGAYLNLGRLYQENASRDASAAQKGLQTYRQLLQFQPDNAEANYQSAVLSSIQVRTCSPTARLKFLVRVLELKEGIAWRHLKLD